MFASRETFFSPAKMSPPVNVCEHRHGLTDGYNFLFIILFYHGSHGSLAPTLAASRRLDYEPLF